MFAVPRVLTQPKPSPLAHPIAAITAKDKAPSSPPAPMTARTVGAPSPGERHRDEPQRQQRRKLHLRRHRDQHHAEHQHRQRQPGRPVGAVTRQSQRTGQQRARGFDTAQRELRAGQHRAQHRRPVMNACDQVHDQPRVGGGAQPQRADLGDPAATGEARRRPDDQPDTDQHHHAVAQHGRDDVLAGKRGDAAANPEEQRPVRRGRVAPQAGHRQREDVVETQRLCRAYAVRVEPSRDISLCAR